MGFNPHAGLLDVERVMKRYFLVAKEVGDLTRIFCAVIEADHNRRSRFRLPTLRRRRKVEGFGLEGDRLTVPGPEAFRSEEHTSELQSLMRISYAVFCLKQKTNNITSTYNKIAYDKLHNTSK